MTLEAILNIQPPRMLLEILALRLYLRQIKSEHCVYMTQASYFLKKDLCYFSSMWGGVHRCVQVLSEVRAARSSGAGVTGSCLLHDMTAGVRE